MEDQLNFYGVSTEPAPDRKDHLREEEQTVDLQGLWEDMCRKHPDKPPGKWDNTLFCDIGYNEPAAKMVGKMRFVVPNDAPTNHMVIKLLDLMSQGFQAPDPIFG